MESLRRDTNEDYQSSLDTSFIHMSDFFAAERRIDGKVHRTQLDYSTTFSNICGCNVYLKYENMQKTGSFKVRGAMNKLLDMSIEDRAKGVVAASAGNHAQGVAYSARLTNTNATIVMPEFAPHAKILATEKYGAKVILKGFSIGESLDHAYSLCEETGSTLVHPYNDKMVIAGQGTIAIELLKDLPTIDAIVSPIGGGGLLSGIAAAMKMMKPDVQVYGVQASGAGSYYESRKKKSIQSLKSVKTVADGIAVNSPGPLTYSLLEKYVDEICLVDDEEISSAMLYLIERCKVISEGAGAAALAAVLKNKFQFKPTDNVVVIISGGNLDVTFLSKVIERGLFSTGRRCSLTLRIPDVPGMLRQILTLISEQRGSVLEINQRQTFDTKIGTCVVEITLDLQGNEHKQAVVNSLLEGGFSVSSI